MECVKRLNVFFIKSGIVAETDNSNPLFVEVCSLKFTVYDSVCMRTHNKFWMRVLEEAGEGWEKVDDLNAAAVETCSVVSYFSSMILHCFCGN